MSSLMGARDDRKVTPGITESSRPRVHRQKGLNKLCNSNKNSIRNLRSKLQKLHSAKIVLPLIFASNLFNVKINWRGELQWQKEASRALTIVVEDDGLKNCQGIAFKMSFFQNISTAGLATSMSAFPILAVQKQPRVRVFTD